VRLQELKLSSTGKGAISQSAEEETDVPGSVFDWEWIYHDGTVQYNCSGLEQEVH